MFVLCALTVVGCASESSSLRPISGAGSPASLEWDDLDAAVKYVAERQSLGLVDTMTVRLEGQEKAIRRYTLVDVRDRPIEIRFSTDPGALSGLRGASVMRSGSVVVRVGRFGDDPLEQEILASLLDRLGVLALID